MVESLIDSSTGTPIGDMTEFGGLAKLFDGDLAQNNPNFGAYKTGLSGYGGLSFSQGKIFSRALFRGWDDRGIVDDGTSGTIFVYGKNGLPSNATDGALIGQTSFTEPSPIAHGNPAEVFSTDTANTYTHIWALVTSPSATGICGGELVLYETTSGGNPPPSSGEPLAIFLGAGQSNMYGNGPLSPPQVYTNASRISMFALDGAWKPGADPLMDPTGSLWPEFNTGVPGLGSMMSFTDTMAGSLNLIDVGVVNSSQGSTTIEQWAKGQPLYDAMIARAQAALLAAPSGSYIAGFVWQQGESNSVNEASALAWPDQFTALVNNVRTDLGIPDLPVVTIGLGPEPGGALTEWPLLRAVERFMKLPSNSLHVITNDLPNSPTDADWHTAASIVTIGQRTAQAMRTLLPPYL